MNIADLNTIDVDLTLASLEEPGSEHINTILAEHDDTDEGRRAALEYILTSVGSFRIPNRVMLDRMAWSLASHDMKILTPHRNHYPEGLRDLGMRAPHTLFVRGDLEILNRDAIAIVGARAATGYGEHTTIEFATGLTDRGYAVVSGGAYGIDGAAHRTAIRNGGKTIAYLAGGLDRYYPVGHDQLLTKVA